MQFSPFIKFFINKIGHKIPVSVYTHQRGDSAPFYQYFSFEIVSIQEGWLRCNCLSKYLNKDVETTQAPKQVYDLQINVFQHSSFESILTGLCQLADPKFFETYPSWSFNESE